MPAFMPAMPAVVLGGITLCSPPAPTQQEAQHQGALWPPKKLLALS